MYISNFPTGIYIGKNKINLLFRRPFPHFAWSFLYRTYLFTKYAIFYPIGRSYEDYATTYKVFSFANKVVSTDQRLYEYIQRDSSIMHSQNISQAMDILIATQEIDNFFNLEDSQLKKVVYMYQLPRLLNAYGISLKSKVKNTELTAKIKGLILKKISIIGFSSFSKRDVIKILLIKLNLLGYLYRIKKMI